MGETTYNVVFDLADAGYRTWSFAAFGLVFVVFGILMLRDPNLLGTKNKPRFRKVFVGCWIGFASLWTLGSFYSTFSEYRRLRNAYDRHTYQVVEGRVEDFHPLPRALHGLERFSVEGVTFEYANSLVTAGFNNTSGHGGPIREGLQVLVWYVGNQTPGCVANTIIHLEVAQAEPAGEE
jgi:hypothetical protein